MRTLHANFIRRAVSAARHHLVARLAGLAAPAAGAGLVLVVSGCGDALPKSSTGEVSRARQVAPSIITPTAPAYREVKVANGGSVSGTVDIDGSLPADTIVKQGIDQVICGDGGPDGSALHRGSRLENVVVWLEGVKAGKEIPPARRFHLDHVKCSLVNRVTTVIAGGTLQVHSHDPLLHRTRFVRQASREMLAVVSEMDVDQVVPDAAVVAKASLVEVTCDVHPWTHGWIAVFDHPYFTVTSETGAFRIDSVPPGSYTLVTWHERSGRSEHAVVVQAGQAVTVAARVTVR